jgi:site-specific DNA-methyltransferase (adenine-specific)
VGGQIILGDCLEKMKDIPEKSIDMILCDLPYSQTSCHWDTVIPFEPLWEQYERITNPNAAIVLTSKQPFTSQLIMSNPGMFRYEWIWEKTKATGFMNAKKMPLVAHENMLVFYKKLPTYNPQKTVGKPFKDNRTGNKSVVVYREDMEFRVQDNQGYRYPRTVIKFQMDSNTVHPTQKPVALFEYLIKTYSNEGDTVLDNCAGSGTTGVACENLKRNYILIEKEEEYYNLIKERLC